MYFRVAEPVLAKEMDYCSAEVCQTNTGCMQSGHKSFRESTNQRSAHWRWNTCLHGRTRAWSPDFRCDRQTAHCVSWLWGMSARDLLGIPDGFPWRLSDGRHGEADCWHSDVASHVTSLVWLSIWRARWELEGNSTARENLEGICSPGCVPVSTTAESDMIARRVCAWARARRMRITPTLGKSRYPITTRRFPNTMSSDDVCVVCAFNSGWLEDCNEEYSEEYVDLSDETDTSEAGVMDCLDESLFNSEDRFTRYVSVQTIEIDKLKRAIVVSAMQPRGIGCSFDELPVRIARVVLWEVTQKDDGVDDWDDLRTMMRMRQERRKKSHW